MDVRELFRSVEVIWVIWLASSLAASFWTAWIVTRFSWPGFRGLLRDERGAAYSLGYVMTIPFYLVFILLVIETTFLLVAKTGTVYAAYAGARTAIVWGSATTPADAEARVQRAARQAMIPFASGTGSRGKNMSQGAATGRTRELLDIYQGRTSRPGSLTYFLSKADYVNRATVTTSGPPATSDADLRVTIDYPYRFNVPGIGQVLGRLGGDGAYFYPIRSTIALQSEAPQNAEQTLGIRYASPN